MANKRISELSSRVPSASDLMLVGDPTTGYSYKCLVSQVGGVTSVFGRVGAVTAQEGDYTLDQLSGVTITSPASGDILRYNGSSWVNSAGGFVPYTGATGNVTLGEYGILAGWYRLDTTPTGTPTDQGTMYWDDSFKTVALVMNGTTQEIGHDQFYHVKNSSGSTIPKGTAVGFAGTDGSSGHLLITPFIANGTSPSSYFMGVTAEAITNGNFGKVQTFGRLDGIDTSAFSEGDILYVSTTTAGAFQTTVPTAPNNIIQVAAVVSDAVNGKLLVRPTLGSKLTSDESVKFTSLANGNVLQYNSTTSLWENVAPSTLAVSNIYTANGTLTGNRTVTMGGNWLRFDGGNIGTGSTTPYNLANYSSLTMGGASNGGGLVMFRAGANNIGYIGGNFSNQLFISNLIANGYISFETNSSERMRIFAGGNIGINTTTDAGFRLDVNGTMRVQGAANFGTASEMRLLSNHTDGAVIIGASNIPSSTFATRNVIVSTGARYLNMTGGSNQIFGRGSGDTLTSGTNNVFIGKNAGNGITTGGANVIISSSDAGNVPATTTSAIHLITGVRNNDASSLPTSYYAFIGGGFNFGNSIRDFYFGQMPFTPDAASVPIVFRAPSGLGTDIGGANFTISAGRGTGTGTPGDVIFSTSTATTTGTTLQSLTSRMIIKGESGNVGIGTTSPTAKLDVVVTGNSTAAIRSIGSGTNAQLSVIGRTTADADLWGVLDADKNTDNIRLRSVTNHAVSIHTNNSERMRIFASGNIGINTTTDAGFRLDVNGTARVQNALTVNTNSGTSTVTIGDGTTGTNSTLRLRRTNNTQAANIFLSTGTSTDNVGIRLLATSNNLLIYNGTTEVYLTSTGNVGIGTTSPSYKLHVSGTARITGNAELSVDSGAYTIIGATGDTSYRLSVDGDLRVYGNIRTAQPTGGTGVGVWRLGSTATGTYTMSTTVCVEIEIGGTLYKLATVS